MSSPRLLSLDAFRGLTIAGMILVNNPGSWASVYAPLQHAPWHGWTPTDLVFPFFLFIVGVAMTFSFGRRLGGVGAMAPAARRLLLLHAVRRSVVLFTLGLVLASGRAKGMATMAAALAAVLALAWWLGRRPWREGAREGALLVLWAALATWLLAFGAPIRIPGVLQRIALCYLAVAVLLLYAPRRSLGWIAAALLLGYWALLELVPVPGAGAGLIDSEVDNLASYIDRLLLDGHLWQNGPRDPEGPLHTLAAITTTLFGVFAGSVLRDQEATPEARTLSLLLRGSLLVVLGYLWGWALPINKPLWTSSYAVFTAGQATCALALCYWFVDARGWRRLAAPAVTYGLNAITVFVGSGLLGSAVARIEVDDGVSVKAWLVGELLAPWLSPPNASLAYALLWVVGWYAVLRVMQARGWILKV